MENFLAHIPTALHFGKGCVEQLGEAGSRLGKRALLIYGKGSVLKNGSYTDTKKQLESAGIAIFEYNGIKPNPLAEDVDAAAKTGIENDIDFIVAIGGGSVIDSAKITAVCIATGASAWDVMKMKVKPVSAIPLIAVLTLAATGTEMNPVAVLQNPGTREKIGYRHERLFPAHSFLDPAYTKSVPANYTAYGIVDLTAHCLEAYFGDGDASLSDRFVEAIIKEGMEYGPMLMKDLENYDLRARIMWAATNALNGLTSYGRLNGDWGVHALGHVLSFLYDMPHGATLSIVYPAWLRNMKNRIPDRIAQLGSQLFGKEDADAAIEGLEAFFSVLGSPVRLSEGGLPKESYDDILKLMNENECTGAARELDNDDRENILKFMV
ncbi:MAG TPA: iron-containing alcohol dehydrogenase [Bacteroidales bacterium]|nr:iron-containing alcohol dehydrogenase [Bacteroidales bacterium]